MSDLSENMLVNVSNHYAEKNLLRTIFIENQTYVGVAEYLRAEHFSDDGHRKIWAAMQELLEMGQPVNFLSLSSCILGNDEIGHTSASEYLDGVVESQDKNENTIEYGGVIYDLYLKRELIQFAQEIIQGASNPKFGVTASALIETAEEQLFDLTAQGDFEGGFIDFRTATLAALYEAEVAFKREDNQWDVAIGIEALDKVIGGLHGGELILLAGRPGMGTTSLATTISYNAAHSSFHKPGTEGAVVGFFSLEIRAQEIAKSIVCDLASLSSVKVHAGELTTDEFKRLAHSGEKSHRLHLFIDDTPTLTMSGLRTRARRLKRQHDIGLVVIDYVQLLSAARSLPEQSQKQALQDNIKHLKMLALELHVPVLAVYHLPERTDVRTNKRPCLNDLSQLEAALRHVDVALLLYREQYDLECAEPIRDQYVSAKEFNVQHHLWSKRIEGIEGVSEVGIASLRGGVSKTVKVPNTLFITN